MNVVIRRASMSDANAMVELLNPIIRAGGLTIMDREVTVPEQLQFIRAFPDRGIFNVAIEPESSRLVGMQDVVPAPGSPEIGEISTFIALDERRRGVGSALMNAMINSSGRKGFTGLRAVIRADNDSAMTFYQRFGFVPSTGRHWSIVGHSRIEQIIAYRSLS